jgi:hypothetical protein
MAKVFGFRYIGFVVPPVTDGTSSPVLVPLDTAHRLIERILNCAATHPDSGTTTVIKK